MTSPFLDMQARVGITVHVGGSAERRALLALCDVEHAREVLEVGCGVGVGPVRIAREHRCRVVGIDISERMVGWARRRAREAGVDDRVDVHVADVLALPFEDGRFDAVIGESVLAFVGDKDRAIAEMVRVTRPGGWVGLDEMFLIDPTPSADAIALARLQATEIETLEGWRALWDRSGLHERVVRTYRIDVRREVRDRLRWVGPAWLARGVLRIAWLYLTEPALRPELRLMLGALPRARGEAHRGRSLPDVYGYGIFAGRK